MNLGWFMNRNRKFSCEKLAVCMIGLSCFCCFFGEQAYAEDVCSRVANDIDVAKCVGVKISASSAELEKYYQTALTNLPDTDNDDDRKTKAQLIKAQAAWKVFVDEQCKYVGGLQGGSSLYVSTFDDECILDETGKRIEFFKHLPMGA